MSKLSTAPTALREWTDRYISRGNWKPATVEQLKIAASNLHIFLGPDKPFKAITQGDAEDFRICLETEARGADVTGQKRGLAKSTVLRRIGRAKQFFHAAVQRDIFSANPFIEEAAAVGTNVARQKLVPSDDVERIIRCATCENWRIILAFARYGGMRRHRMHDSALGGHRLSEAPDDRQVAQDAADAGMSNLSGASAPLDPSQGNGARGS